MKIRTILLFTALYVGAINSMDENRCVYSPAAFLDDIARQEIQKLDYFCNVESKGKPLDELNQHIAQELASIKDEAHVKEKQAMEAFRKKFPLTDAAWVNFAIVSDIAQKLNKDYMGEFSCVCTHNDSHVEYIQEELKKKNINPACIRLKYQSKKMAKHTFIKVKSPMSHEIKFIGDAVQFSNNTARLGKYTMYNLLFEQIKDVEKQKVICNTMLYYILEQTSTKRQLLLDFLSSHSKDQTHKKIRNLQEWKDLDIAHEMKVFIRFCSDNPDQVGLLCKVSQERCIDSSVFRVICQMYRLIAAQGWLDNNPPLQSIT